MPGLAGEHEEDRWEDDLWLRKQHIMGGSHEGKSLPHRPHWLPVHSGQHGRVQQVQPVLEELFPINHS